jgi:hypothetical protein
MSKKTDTIKQRYADIKAMNSPEYNAGFLVGVLASTPAKSEAHAWAHGEVLQRATGAAPYAPPKEAV